MKNASKITFSIALIFSIASICITLYVNKNNRQIIANQDYIRNQRIIKQKNQTIQESIDKLSCGNTIELIIHPTYAYLDNQFKEEDGRIPLGKQYYEVNKNADGSLFLANPYALLLVEKKAREGMLDSMLVIKKLCIHKQKN